MGDKEGARERITIALERYLEVRGSVASVFRGRALRPIAEAYVKFGDALSADEAYRRALVEAVESPNARPRLEDLVQTVRSIATSGHTPSKALRRQLQTIGVDLLAGWGG